LGRPIQIPSSSVHVGHGTTHGLCRHYLASTQRQDSPLNPTTEEAIVRPETHHESNYGMLPNHIDSRTGKRDVPPTPKAPTPRKDPENHYPNANTPARTPPAQMDPRLPPKPLSNLPFPSNLENIAKQFPTYKSSIQTTIVLIEWQGGRQSYRSTISRFTMSRVRLEGLRSSVRWVPTCQPLCPL
jgi:hypothetical protein